MSFNLERLAAGLERLLHRRPVRGRRALLLELGGDGRPGDDHLDGARRHQRLRPLEVEVPGLRDRLRLHAARRLHAGPDRAAALGLPPRQARSRQLGLRPHPRPLHPGPVVHDAVLPQLLRQHPRRSHQGSAHRRCRLLAHLLADHRAALAADHHRDRDLAVHRHLERVPLRRRAQLGRQPADHRGARRAVDERHHGAHLRRDERRGADRRAAAASRLLLRRQVFCPRAHSREQSSKWRR